MVGCVMADVLMRFLTLEALVFEKRSYMHRLNSYYQNMSKSIKVMGYTRMRLLADGWTEAMLITISHKPISLGIKMPIIVGIFIFISRENFMLI